MTEQSWDNIQKENIFNNYRDEWIRFNRTDLILDEKNFEETFNSELKKLIESTRIPLETIDNINDLLNRFILLFLKELNTHTNFPRKKSPVNSLSQTPSWLLPFPHRNFGRKLSFKINQNIENESTDQDINDLNYNQDKKHSLKLETFGPYSIEELLSLAEE